MCICGCSGVAYMGVQMYIHGCPGVHTWVSRYAFMGVQMYRCMYMGVRVYVHSVQVFADVHVFIEAGG